MGKGRKGKGSLRAALLAGLTLVGSCRSMEDWNPDVDIRRHDAVVVEAFAYAGEQPLGEELADQLAAALRQRELFAEVLREAGDREAWVVSGKIRDYDRGNVAARMKYGRGIGESRMSVVVTVEESSSGRRAGSFRVEETTLLTSPKAGRTGREKGEWVQRQVVERIVESLEERWERATPAR